MTWGKSILAALFLAVSCHTGLLAGEAAGIYGDADVTSIRRNATIHIGGEFRTDYSYRSSKDTPTTQPRATTARDIRTSDFSVTGANLRLRADVHPNVSAFLKIDLHGQVEPGGTRSDILEEAMLVMSAVGGTGLGFFTGQGRAPYGQDITLGMLQSYHHTADRDDSSEGRIFITDTPDLPDSGNASGGTAPRAKSLPLMRPGQVDRVIMAGASYEWQDRWKVEIAAFQPGVERYEARLRDTSDKSAGRIGFAGRIWWRPIEELTIQASAMVTRSHRMANVAQRVDVLPGATGSDTAKAISIGADYRRGPWRIFGEYQHGWDWNFTKGYSTDTWQVGAARKIGYGVTLAAAVEGLHIDDASPADTVRHDFTRVALSARKAFENGFFVLAEYGHEWRRRERAGVLLDKARGDFFGMRVGFVF